MIYLLTASLVMMTLIVYACHRMLVAAESEKKLVVRPGQAERSNDVSVEEVDKNAQTEVLRLRGTQIDISSLIERNKELAPVAAAAAFPQGLAVGNETAQSEQSEVDADLLQLIERIKLLPQAPFSPSEYLDLFDLMAQESSKNLRQDENSVEPIFDRATALGITIHRDDARDIYSSYCQTAGRTGRVFEIELTADLFARRLRNYFVFKRQGQGFALTASELVLLDKWFLGAAHRYVLVHEPELLKALSFLAAMVPDSEPSSGVT